MSDRAPPGERPAAGCLIWRVNKKPARSGKQTSASALAAALLPKSERALAPSAAFKSLPALEVEKA